MSAGMADCSEYRDLVQLVIDGEASSQEETYLRRHLKMCLKCLDRYNIDSEIKQMLKLKLAKMEVPAGLAETIRSKLVQ
ncbi:MAG: zf-HC2 domain-containing protein [Cyclobacteriaceae bacterium]